MQYILTIHANERMDKCGITFDQVVTAIQRGAKTKQTDGFLVVYTYIRVAYAIRGEKCIIKTVMIQD